MRLRRRGFIIRREKGISDLKVRTDLAKLIGLDEIPDFDPAAIDKLDGLLDGLVDGPVDCVELLRESRVRDYYKRYSNSEE